MRRARWGVAAVARIVAIATGVFATSIPGVARAQERAGVYGGLALGGALEPTGSGNELERGCADLGAASCSTPIPIGGVLFAYAGFARPPFAVEGMIGGMGDVHRPSARFDGVTHVPHGNPLVASPPRDETFVILRGAALLALRGRYTHDGEHLRETIAAGLGLAYRYAALEREAKSDAGLEDRPYFPSGAGYVSPALNIDAALQLRATPTLAVAIGLFTWIESAGSGVRSAADPQRVLAGDAGLAPIATPEYRMTSGVQLFACPYVALQFGP